MKSMFTHTWSLGTPSGTESDFLSGHVLLHCQAFILGAWQGIQSLLCAKHGIGHLHVFKGTICHQKLGTKDPGQRKT